MERKEGEITQTHLIFDNLADTHLSQQPYFVLWSCFLCLEAVFSDSCCSRIHSLGRLLQGYLWHYSDCHRHPLLIPMHHQHLRIVTYLFFHFLPPQLSGMQNSWLLFLAFLFTQHANTPFSSIFVSCLVLQPTVTQPCQHRRNGSSTGAQQAEEGDKEAASTRVALPNLCRHHSLEDGGRKRPVQLKESSPSF